MTNRERENLTLGFGKPGERGTVGETFYPWSLTASRFKQDGMPADIADNAQDITNNLSGCENNSRELYLPVSWGEGVMNYETYLGFDPVRRIHFVLPFRRFEEKVLEETPQYIIRQDIYGRQMKRVRGSEIEVEHKPVIADSDDWEKLKQHAEAELEKHFTDENITAAYGGLAQKHEKGEYSIRLNLEGFFWVPRELMGIEAHLYAFYDEPELIHSINEYILHIYTTKLEKVLKLVQPDVVYIMEDLSGKNGPMISGQLFDEFVGEYYKKLIPFLKENGVKHVLVDTDGDFNLIIPNFIAAGTDGFLPMDVNAGMDILKVREQYPELKLIGGFNKLCIEQGPDAIDEEFRRIMPVIRQGGYIPGADHQVTPSTSLENYKYYIGKLKDAMTHAGEDIT